MWAEVLYCKVKFLASPAAGCIVRFVLIPIVNWYVPRYVALEIRVKFDLVPCLGEEYYKFRVIISMQHSEQRGVILNGVSAEDAESFHDWIMVSTSPRNAKALFRAV